MDIKINNNVIQITEREESMNNKLIQMIENYHVYKALQLFNLKENFTLEDLNERYKKLAFKMHPDHGGSITKMQELNNGKKILEGYLKHKNFKRKHIRKHLNKNLSKREVSTASYIQISLMIIICYALIIFLFS